jgi:hypothetical protein
VETVRDANRSFPRLSGRPRARLGRKRGNPKMKLTATEDKNGARSLIVDYEDRVPDKDSVRLVEAGHRWIWEPFERRQKKQKQNYND